MINLTQLLRDMLPMVCSDLHLRANMLPIYRQHGALIPADKIALTKQDMETIVGQLLTDEQRKRFDQEKELDLAISLKEVGRFRVNVFVQKGTYAIAFRLLPFNIPSFDELHLPPVLVKLADKRRGLILVTGITGSGKSTTLASIIDYINTHRAENIITIEDPIEYAHNNKMSIIAQREVGADTSSFALALRQSLREDPDIILLGEIRDAATMSTALAAADTGHLVLSTLHTMDAKQAIFRVLSFFPPHQHHEIRLLLANNLQAVISQRLLPRVDIPGRVPAVEILISTLAVRDCIVNEDKTHGVSDLIADGKIQYGMQTLDQSLMDLFENGLISLETAILNATNPDDFRLRVAGIKGASDRGWKGFVKETRDEEEPLSRKKEEKELKVDGEPEEPPPDMLDEF
ncbi:type IV pilus twitching motility protein PilT [bacterium]|nr:type IV pilus twitching motility protein PilT [bacterium]